MSTETLDRGDAFTPTGDEIQQEEYSVTKDEGQKDAAPVEDKAATEEPQVEGEEKEGEEKEGEEKKERAKYIPRARFDKALEKAKSREAALQQQIAELQAGKQTAKQTEDLQYIRAEIDELQDKYEDLLLDGKKAEAKALRTQIRAKEEALIDYKSSVTSQAAREQTIEQLKYEQALAKAETDYPELNPDHDDFSPEITEEVADLVESFLARGYRRQSALERAVRYVLGTSREKATDREEAKLERDKAARQKAADANTKQPQSMAKIGVDSDKAGKSERGPDVLRMSQEQFAKLDEETKAKLRGDDF